MPRLNFIEELSTHNNVTHTSSEHTSHQKLAVAVPEALTVPIEYSQTSIIRSARDRMNPFE